MITPEYVQIKKSLSFSEEYWDKWYCVYFETVGRFKIARYMHPLGWMRFCHYFDTKEDAEKAFNKYGHIPRPVTNQEIMDHSNMERDCQDDFDDRQYYDNYSGLGLD